MNGVFLSTELCQYISQLKTSLSKIFRTHRADFGIEKHLIDEVSQETGASSRLAPLLSRLVIVMHLTIELITLLTAYVRIF
jgi:hypothetical protein